LLLLLGVALLLAARCGSSGSSRSASTAGKPNGTIGGVSPLGAFASRELDRLAQQLPRATARLPAASTTTSIERAYLTALFDDAQSVWRREFEASHLAYKPARLVLFWSKVRSGCGTHDDSGPFYCPVDREIYLDLRFFTLLARQVGPSGAPQAYIVGHEFGHHIQRLLGIADRVEAANKADASGENARSLRVELESDCLAGVWGRSAYERSELTIKDLGDALKAAEVIGDDYLMEAAGKVVDSAQWTHGSSQQRQHWTRMGYKSGRPSSCDTFEGG
jgi:uncharacterized protein